MSQPTPNRLNDIQQSALNFGNALRQSALENSLALTNERIAMAQSIAMQKAMALQSQIGLGPQQLSQLQQYYSQVMGSAPVQLVSKLDMTKAELLAGPIIGYRGWNVSAQGYLISVTRAEIWLPGEPFVAQCNRPVHDDQVPMSGCSCGTYAYRVREKFSWHRPEHSRCYGTVALWGTVIQHEKGYRAQFAYPLALWTPRSPMPGFPESTKLATLAASYGVSTMPEPEA